MIKVRLKRKKTPINKSQLEFDFGRPAEKDRNHHLGGRSFYFFDFDDNVAYLSTPIVLFHKEDGHEELLSSGEWAQNHAVIGKSGRYADYYVDFDDESGSFKYFRDQNLSVIEKMTRKKQTFVSDIESILSLADYAWKAPSWNCFYHATYNKRPISVITARGHNSQTIKDGINLIVKRGHLPHKPNYLSIYPVTNPRIRTTELGDPELKLSVADLKRAAISGSVERAIELYGESSFHRFGMSDDDPKNIELITEEMKVLKRKYPEMAFFVIQTFDDHFVKTEVLQNSTRNIPKRNTSTTQLQLF